MAGIARGVNAWGDGSGRRTTVEVGETDGLSPAIAAEPPISAEQNPRWGAHRRVDYHRVQSYHQRHQTVEIGEIPVVSSWPRPATGWASAELLGGREAGICPLVATRHRAATPCELVAARESGDGFAIFEGRPSGWTRAPRQAYAPQHHQVRSRSSARSQESG